MSDIEKLESVCRKLIESSDFLGFSNRELRQAARPFVLLELLDERARLLEVLKEARWECKNRKDHNRKLAKFVEACADIEVGE